MENNLPFIPDGLPAGSQLYARAYNTHYEIINYKMGDCKKIEADLSIWDPVYYKRIEYYYYDKKHKVLYIPRGYDANIVAEQTGRPINFMENHRPKKRFHFSVGTPPRDAYQREMIRYLTGKEEYEKMFFESQQVLSLPTRSGKTYCTITAVSILESKALVIVNSDTLREQWASEILSHTQLSESNIKIVKSSKFFDPVSKDRKKRFKDTYIYIVTHRTIHNAIKLHGMQIVNDALRDLDIGIKIIDEAHIEFRNTLMTDYATNVWKTFYLTATFARSDAQENLIFQKSFNQVMKIAKKNPEREKTVKLFMVSFRTKPTDAEVQSICFKKMGFSRYAYINYEFTKGKLDEVVTSILKIVIEQKQLEGRILILSSKIESCDHFKQLAEELFPAYTVCSHHSDNKVEDFREYGIICATPSMLGTGTTIPGLRIVLNTEPTSSAVNTVQIFGRLDIYAPGMDTYYFMIMDTGFVKIKKMFNRIKNILKYQAKEIIDFDYS